MFATFMLGFGESGGFGNKLRVIKSVDAGNCRFEILELESLEGAKELENAESLYYAAKQGIRPKFIKIVLNSGSVFIESGSLYMRVGKIQSKATLSGTSADGGLKGMLENAFRSAVNNESLVKPQYSGTGEIWLTPTYDHVIVLKITEAWGDVICDKGMFYACEEGVDVSACMNTVTGAVGSECVWQTKLRGNGCILLRSPVPASEVMVFKLNRDVVQINGNFVIARSGDIQYTLQRSMDTLAGSLISGEGLMQTFEGTGMVFAVPTARLYPGVFQKIESKESDGVAV